MNWKTSLGIAFWLIVFTMGLGLFVISVTDMAKSGVFGFDRHGNAKPVFQNASPVVHKAEPVVEPTLQFQKDPTADSIFTLGLTGPSYVYRGDPVFQITGLGATILMGANSPEYRRPKNISDIEITVYTQDGKAWQAVWMPKGEK